MKGFLLLLLLLPLASAATNTSTSTIVRDVEGKPLRRSHEYYILPVIRGRGGGLTLSQRNNTCPFYVTQESDETSSGLPLIFSPVYPRDKLVPLSTDLNVEFSAATICVQSTVWELDIDVATGRSYVTTGGVKGNPGPDTVSNWFKIERYDSDSDSGNGKYYKLVFCPGVCSICRVLCGDVGIFVEQGRRWLGLSDMPFPVMFKRAK
ncbi:putative alpha-amylase/subtilisin inhibitor [Iris pallida]|uniref:Alpha-amylase/subtilisin inhibitor n=1 Tax=Iris pallida TaxID=29817 RepID=A0AAX6G2W8_IRIPA|nr:putative alpha-amylase/subtilisin inhibitor [Iris pallida]KAJ6822668.1 putative alpha-amylase/subtilisin inhibitor [Iris pallida]